MYNRVLSIHGDGSSSSRSRRKNSERDHCYCISRSHDEVVPRHRHNVAFHLTTIAPAQVHWKRSKREQKKLIVLEIYLPEGLMDLTNSTQHFRTSSNRLYYLINICRWTRYSLKRQHASSCSSPDTARIIQTLNVAYHLQISVIADYLHTEPLPITGALFNWGHF